MGEGPGRVAAPATLGSGAQLAAPDGRCERVPAVCRERDHRAVRVLAVAYGDGGGEAVSDLNASSVRIAGQVSSCQCRTACPASSSTWCTPTGLPRGRHCSQHSAPPIRSRGDSSQDPATGPLVLVVLGGALSRPGRITRHTGCFTGDWQGGLCGPRSPASYTARCESARRLNTAGLRSVQKAQHHAGRSRRVGVLP